ncbi:MAG TPA: helix-turn-helix transcriptional regulator [Trueperaceae bacterium]
MPTSTATRGIGWAIRKVRKSQERTLEDVAAAAGTDPSNLSRVERGMQDPPERQLRAIATALNVSVSSLWTLAERGSDDSDDTGQLLALSAMLSPEQRQRLLDYAGYLLDRQAD